MIFKNPNRDCELMTESVYSILEANKFEPSEKIPNSLRKEAKSLVSSIVKDVESLDKNDKKVAKNIKLLKQFEDIASDSNYNQNSFPVGVDASIFNKKSFEYIVPKLKSNGFRHADGMKDGTKAQTWYKTVGKDIIVATCIGTIIGNNQITVILHANKNNDHNIKMLKGINESYSISSEEELKQQNEETDAPSTPEELYGFIPDLGLTRSEELVSDPEYKNFFRDPKIMKTFTEYLDLSDSLTRKAVLCMNEADQGSVLTALTSKLYDNIVSKVDDIDFGEIPASKGDITKLSNYEKLKECVELLKDILKEFKQDTAPIDAISLAMSNVSTNKDIFMRAFKLDCELPIIMYNTIVLAIISAVSYMIATCIEFMKTPNQDSFQITLDRVSFAKTKNNMLYNNLKKFNKCCSSGDLQKSLEHVIQNKVKGVREAAVGVILGGLGAVAGIAGVIAIARNIIPLLRELVYFFYYTRMRVSDFFDIQADLLQMNAYNLQNDTTKNDEEKDRIVSKQLKIVELFRKIANKISFTGRKAEVDATKEITNTSKKMKLNDISDELPDSVASALF